MKNAIDDNSMEDSITCWSCNRNEVEFELFDSIFRLNCNECAKCITKQARGKWTEDKKAGLVQCNYCLMSFRLEQPLEHHLCLREDVITCTECGQQLYSKEDLGKHTKYLHKNECKVENERCEVSGLIEMNSREQKDSFEISVHKKLIGIKGNNNKKRDCVKSRQCQYCSKKFVFLNELNRHVNIHTGEKHYQCEICKRKFTQRGHLKTHFLTHTGEAPYQCKVCQKTCLTSGHLKIHTRTHTGDKPYQCNVCQKEFFQSIDLRRHVRIHTGERPYECNVCQKRFLTSGHLKMHARTHTGQKPHQCGICQAKFFESCYLKRHLRTHTGEKPHQCKICEKKFYKFSDLNRHFRTHTGEKPYRCKICNIEFARSDHLKQHARSIHAANKT